MRFSTIAMVCISNVGAFVITARDNNTCFDMNKGQCMGYTADATNATAIVTLACQKVASCKQGVMVNRPRVTGSMKGFPYTATLYVGDQCGGVATWSTEACVGLFHQFVDGRCKAQYPAGTDKYDCYETATCDGSSVSLNFGG